MQVIQCVTYLLMLILVSSLFLAFFVSSMVLPFLFAFWFFLASDPFAPGAVPRFSGSPCPFTTPAAVPWRDGTGGWSHIYSAVHDPIRPS